MNYLVKRKWKMSKVVLKISMKDTPIRHNITPQNIMPDMIYVPLVPNEE